MRGDDPLFDRLLDEGFGYLAKIIPAVDCWC